MALLEFCHDELCTEVTPEQTILDAALSLQIPMVHSCGGQARCSTCRVMVTEGLSLCSPRSEAETRIADLLVFPQDVRLACQTRIHGDVKVRRLVRDPLDRRLIGNIREKIPGPVGNEKKVAVLFADIRSFTSFSEKLPPYDVVHVLNRYFDAMGEAIRLYRGNIYNYMGDGLMALFGVEHTDCPVSDAVHAAHAMLERVECLRPYFQSIYDRCFQIGIGIHYGNVVIGAIGAEGTRRMTAIGDAVNVASRIESMTKKAGCAILISEEAERCLAGKIKARPKCAEIALAGKSGQHTLYEVDNPLTAETEHKEAL